MTVIQSTTVEELAGLRPPTKDAWSWWSLSVAGTPQPFNPLAPAALTTLRAKFHRALVIGGTDAEFADAACEQADAALALAAPAPQPEPATGASPSVPTPASTEVA